MLHAIARSRRSVRSHRPLPTVVALGLTALLAATLSAPGQTAAALEGPDTPPDPATPPPNVLLVTTDDQATTDLRFMPFTRRFFAEGGVTFTDAVSPYPLCCPARATILTGQMSHNHDVLTNHAPDGGYEKFRTSGLERRALPTWLQTAGYDTMFVGKYLNGYGAPPYRDVRPPGWTEWNATAGEGIYSYYDFGMWRDDVLTRYPEAYQTNVAGQVTREFLEEQSSGPVDRPFFVWESNLAPHGGCRVRRDGGCRWGPPEPAAQDRNAFPDLRLNRPRHGSFNERVVVDKPAHVRAVPAWTAGKRDRMTHYNRQRARSLRAVDRSFRATVGKLEELGELDDTLVIFTSDNGFLIGQHRWHGKILPYEPSLRVPLLMRGPGLEDVAGTRVTDTVTLVDVAPTIAEAAGARPTLAVDGQDLRAVAQGTRSGYGALAIEAGSPDPESSPGWFYRGVRTRRYTFVRYPGRNQLELYDRRDDPDQETNVAYRPAYRATRRVLADKLARVQDCAAAVCYGVGGDGIPEPRPEPHLDSGATVHPDELGSLGRARQVVTVTAPGWRGGGGLLTAWQRRGRTWTVERGPFPVRLGANGLVREPQRRAGGGETPAGTFTPETGFGLRPKVGGELPYRRVDRNDRWVFDPRVPATYNINQPRRSPRATWRLRHSVRWAAEPARFSRGMLVDYNLPRGVRRSAEFGELRSSVPADVRKGSFVLHAGSRFGRHGWVSMPRRRLTWLLRWTQTGRTGARFVVGTPGYLRRRL